MGRSKMELPEGARSYGFWERFSLLSFISMLIATAFAMGTCAWLRYVDDFSWVGVGLAYVCGALAVHLAWLRTVFDSDEKKKHQKHLIALFEMTDPDMLRKDKIEYIWDSILGHPFVLGPVYCLFKIIKFSTKWVWTAVLCFAAIGWAFGTFMDHHPYGFATIGIFIGILIAYKRKHPGLPPAPATT